MILDYQAMYIGMSWKFETVKECINNSEWLSRDLFQMLHTDIDGANNEMIWRWNLVEMRMKRSIKY